MRVSPPANFLTPVGCFLLHDRLVEKAPEQPCHLSAALIVFNTTVLATELLRFV